MRFVSSSALPVCMRFTNLYVHGYVVLYMLQYSVCGEGFCLDFGFLLIGPYQGGHSPAISDIKLRLLHAELLCITALNTSTVDKTLCFHLAGVHAWAYVTTPQSVHIF